MSAEAGTSATAAVVDQEKKKRHHKEKEAQQQQLQLQQQQSGQPQQQGQGQGQQQSGPASGASTIASGGAVPSVRLMETFADVESIDPMLVIKLNVGGVKFQTTFPTLKRAPGESGKKESYFTQILTGTIAVPRDDEGAFFIDRDPNLFAPLLEYLRTGKYHAPESLLDAVYRESSFYGIQLPTTKIFEKENEYRTEVAAVPAGSKVDAVQAAIADKETQGFTFINASSSKDLLFLFFKK